MIDLETMVLSSRQYLVASITVAGIAMISNAVAEENNAGRVVYEKACIACHGDDGEGTMPGVPDLTASASVLRKPEDELVQNTLNGMQSPGSPMPMPPKGGNPALTKQEIIDAVRYMRKTFLR